MYPLCLVTVIFFLWGFSYGLLGTLKTLGISKPRSSRLQAAYFGGVTIITRDSYTQRAKQESANRPGRTPSHRWATRRGSFCACIFIIGNGLGAFETAANPYSTVCGPPRFAELRIDIAQAFNGIDAVVAPVLGSYVFLAFGEAAVVRNA